MPYYAYVAAELKCPNCHNILTDIVRFQWGYCAGYGIRQQYLYKIGDPIYWKPCKDGLLLSWVGFGEDGTNIGDPQFRDLIVKDVGKYDLSETCSQCGLKLGETAVEINDGIIKRTWLCQPGEFDGNIDIYLVEDNQSLKPMEEWNDHPISEVTDC